MTDSITKPIYLSIAGHILLLVFFAVHAIWFPSEPIQIRHAIRVDLVGLPQKITHPPVELPKAPPKVAVPEKKAEPKPQAPKVNLRKNHREEEDAINQIKAMAAVQKIESEVSAQKHRQQAKAQAVQGNAVHRGNSLTGLDKLDYNDYFNNVKGAVHQQWNIPQWMQDANFKASALVLIDERGYVIKAKIVKSSGNEIFDSRVLAAIRSASPLPPPPDRLRSILGNEGIIFNFPD